MWVKSKQQNGFTIVELLIVVVVIAILAAITIVSYNGIQNRAKDSAITQELSQNAKKITAESLSSSTGRYSIAYVLPSGVAAVKMDMTKYKVVTFCTNGDEFVYGAQAVSGKKYFIRSGSNVVNDDTKNIFTPCSDYSIANASTTYLNLPTACSAQASNCTLTGTATVVYGTAVNGVYFNKQNQTVSVACNDGTFGDPAPTYAKSCYAFPN
jgi:prepilin-type N-terminal cleavage/methylation domain-containing protein